MKQNLLFATLFSALTFVSCNDNGEAQEPGTYPDKAAYVSITVVESKEVEDEELYCFTMDNGDKLFLADNPLNIDLSEENPERIVIYYAVIEDYSEEGSESLAGASYECDYGIRLFDKKEVYLSESATVENKEESELISDHALAYLYNSFSYGNGYINILAGIKADKLEDINFYLVENLYEDPEKDEPDYLCLELRYDRGTDESVGTTTEQFVCLGLDAFKDQLEGKAGVLLRVLTATSGTGYAKIDIDTDADSRAISVMRSAEQL